MLLILLHLLKNKIFNFQTEEMRGLISDLRICKDINFSRRIQISQEPADILNLFCSDIHGSNWYPERMLLRYPMLQLISWTYTFQISKNSADILNLYCSDIQGTSWYFEHILFKYSIHPAVNSIWMNNEQHVKGWT